MEDLFCECLATNTRGAEVVKVLKNFVEPYGLPWNNRVDICVDDTKAVVGKTTEVLAPRQEQTALTAIMRFAATHCQLKGKSKKPVSLYDVLDEAVRVINLVNLNACTCLFFSMTF